MLIDTLLYLFPTIRPGIDFVLQDDGAGPYIKTWSFGQPQSTADQISAAATAAQTAATQAALEAQFVAAVQLMLDTKAKERNYDGILSACSYANSTNAQFKAEGQACLDWRDAVWAQCYTDLAAVQAGTMQQPTVEAFIASLPQLTWPS